MNLVMLKEEGCRIKFDVTANTLPVLVRRLLESGSDSAVTLASDICSTLDIELI